MVENDPRFMSFYDNWWAGFKPLHLIYNCKLMTAVTEMESKQRERDVSKVQTVRGARGETKSTSEINNMYWKTIIAHGSAQQPVILHISVAFSFNILRDFRAAPLQCNVIKVKH